MVWDATRPSGSDSIKDSDDLIRDNWVAIQSGSIPFGGAGAQGDILIQTGASQWAHLSPGASGSFLETLGSGINPQWSDQPDEHNFALSTGQVVM